MALRYAPDDPEVQARVRNAESGLVYENLWRTLSRVGPMLPEHEQEITALIAEPASSIGGAVDVQKARLAYMRACRRGISLHDRSAAQSRLNVAKVKKALREALPRLSDEHAALVRGALRDGRPLPSLATLARL